jgi:hypothetical protein
VQGRSLGVVAQCRARQGPGGCASVARASRRTTGALGSGTGASLGRGAGLSDGRDRLGVAWLLSIVAAARMRRQREREGERREKGREQAG